MTTAIDTKARGGAPFVVYADDVEVSRHDDERKALERCMTGVSMDHQVENPGMPLTYEGGLWPVGGGSIVQGTRQWELVTTGLADKLGVGPISGSAYRHWIMAGDSAGFYGPVICNDWSTWTPPGWGGALGTPNHIYWRFRFKYAADYVEHSGREKIAGYLGAAGAGAKNDFYISIHTGGGNSNTIQFVSQDGHQGGTLFRNVGSANLTEKDRWYDVEVLLTSSKSGPGTGGVKMWLDRALYMDHTGRNWAPNGLNGFQFQHYRGGSGGIVAVGSYIDYAVVYVSAEA